MNLNNYFKLPMETFQSVCCFFICEVGNNEAQYPDKGYSLKEYCISAVIRSKILNSKV